MSVTSAVKGGIGGGMAGGSTGNPYAAAAGAGLGLIAGIFDDSDEQKDAYRKRLEDYFTKVNGREAPTFGNAAQSQYSSFRGNQADLASRLDAQARGLGPSVAGEQLKAAQQRNAAQQYSMAASGRGGPLAAQVAANNTARLGAQSAQDASLARVAEQMQANQALGQVLQGARQGDENTNQFNAGAQNDAMRANLEARLRTMGMNDQAIVNILAQLGGQVNQPGVSDQILAGGAAMFNQGRSQAAAGKAGGAG